MTKDNKPKYSGYGYHGGGRPRKAENEKCRTLSISGTPEQVARLREVASSMGLTVSGLVWYLLNGFTY